MSVSAQSIAPVRKLDDGDFLQAMGKRVREARERRGMSRRALSESAEVSERYLAQLEGGEGNASVVLLRRVATALSVSLTDLVGDNESPVEQRLIRRFFERLPAHRLEDVILQLMRDFGQKEAARKNRIALVGLRGAGKSSLGAAVAKDLRYPFVELDREIEREAALPLSEVFMLYGQAGYRRVERRCLDRLLERGDSMVLAAGGGIVSEPETYNALLVNCYTVWIKAAPEEHMSRVISQGDFRPMDGHEAAMEDLRRILAARDPLYAKADAIVDTTGERFEQSLAKLTHAIAELAHV
ncbi:MAG TPA: helix-turn-helix transcriptional regulator [Casimicrobiaceae bacterium]|jgi:XRE family aerobic/anaerobic benzoate catabolism transcriptional regulator